MTGSNVDSAVVAALAEPATPNRGEPFPAAPGSSRRLREPEARSPRASTRQPDMHARTAVHTPRGRR